VTRALPRSPLAGYRDLLGIPRFGRIVVAGVAAKLPPAILSLSVLLLVGPRYSYGLAGLAVGGLAIGQGLTDPVRGRLVDRYRPGPILLTCLAGYLGALSLLVLSVRAHGPAVLPVTAAVAAGTMAPPVGIMMRAIWHAGTGTRTLTTAMALDASLTGASLVVGPVLAGWLSVGLSPAAPFVVVAVLLTLAVALLIGLPFPAPADRPAHWLGPLTSAPLRRLFAAYTLYLVGITAVDVVLPVYAVRSGAPLFTGLYLGAMSVGSLLGSLGLGAVPHLLSRRRAVPALLCGFALAAALLALATRGGPLVVLLVAPVAGTVVGSTFGALFTVGGNLAPPGQVTETMAWLSSLGQVGGAAGAAFSAHLAVAAGSTTALLAVPPIALLAALFAGRAHAAAPTESETPGR